VGGATEEASLVSRRGPEGRRGSETAIDGDAARWKRPSNRDEVAQPGCLSTCPRCRLDRGGEDATGKWRRMDTRLEPSSYVYRFLSEMKHPADRGSQIRSAVRVGILNLDAWLSLSLSRVCR